MKTTFYISNSIDETLKIARDFSSKLKNGDVVALIGNLGTGKTIFVKGICEGLKANQNPLSPTFSIINEYLGKFKIYHFDFYRIKDIEELYDIGYEDYFNNDGICLIEWADLFENLLPENHYRVLIDFGENDSQRKITIEEI